MASDVPMPSAPTEESVARWLFNIDYPRHAWEEADSGHIDTYLASARAVLAWTEAKVREALDLVCSCKNRDCECDAPHDDEIVIARVMGKEAT